ncbi:PQQ-binding-like beta-propeller repeat protein [bacterium]|nr:PQQ-binding-like beta-propeller repeat protein [bacterium]
MRWNLGAGGLGLCLLAATAVVADDWPQWRGPQRDGVWRETGIVENIPAEGLPVKWRVPVQAGYSGPAVAGGRVFLTDYVRESGETKNDPGTRNELQGKERVLCFDAVTGKPLWEYAYPCPYKISYPSGPRATPTVDGDRVYTLGAEGDLLCLNVESGGVLWHKSLKDEYHIEAPIWGFSGHPLVDGDQLICLVGGAGSVAVAFDKQTGKENWKALSASEPGYAPPSIITAGGVRQLLIWDADNLNSLNPETGAVYWSQPLKPSYGMSIMAPQKSGNMLFASGIGKVGAAFRLAANRPAAERVWNGAAKSAVYCANSTPYLQDDMIYGVDCDTGFLMGVKLADGSRVWETSDPTSGTRRARHATAFLVQQEDRTFLFSETGDLILARLTPESYTELGRFHVLAPTGECFGREVVWSHPAFAERCVFARNDRELVCVSLALPDVVK